MPPTIAVKSVGDSGPAWYELAIPGAAALLGAVIAGGVALLVVKKQVTADTTARAETAKADRALRRLEIDLADLDRRRTYYTTLSDSLAASVGAVEQFARTNSAEAAVQQARSRMWALLYRLPAADTEHAAIESNTRKMLEAQWTAVKDKVRLASCGLTAADADAALTATRASARLVNDSIARELTTIDQQSEAAWQQAKADGL